MQVVNVSSYHTAVGRLTPAQAINVTVPPYHTAVGRFLIPAKLQDKANFWKNLPGSVKLVETQTVYYDVYVFNGIPYVMNADLCDLTKSLIPREFPDN